MSVGVLPSSEIDYVTRDPEGIKCYQVAMSALDPVTLDREQKPLKAVNDDYPKTLLTLDRIGVGDRDGVRQENIIDWVLRELRLGAGLRTLARTRPSGRKVTLGGSYLSQRISEMQQSASREPG